MTTKLLGIAFLACTFTACKKDDKQTCPTSMAGIAGTYKPTKFEFGTGSSYVDVTSSFEACQLDDKLILNADGTSVYQDAGLACDPSGNESGTWSVAADGTLTIAAGSIDVTNATVNSFDCTTLVVVATESGTNFRATFVK